MFSFPAHQSQLSPHMRRSDVDIPVFAMDGASATSSIYEQRDSVDTVHATHHRPSTADSALSERDGPQIQRIKKSLFTSNIPILRRARSTLGRSSEAPPPAQEVKPSRFLDIPNSSSNNKLAYDNPVYKNPFASPPDDLRLGVEVSITAGNAKRKKSSFAEKAAKFGIGAFSPGDRQIWRSASGRSPSVEPISRQGSSVYSIVRTPSRDLSTAGSGGSSWSNASEIKSQHKRNASPSGEARLKQVSSRDQPLDETFKPIPPLKISKRPQTPTQNEPQNSLPQGPLTPRANPIFANTNSRVLSQSSNAGSQIVRKPVASQGADCENIPPPESPDMDRYNANQPKSHFSWTTYADSVVDEDERPSPENQQRGPQRGPTSHFSWSTVNTNTTCQTESPSSSPPAYTNSLQSSMMARRRPVPAPDLPSRRHVSASQVPVYETPISYPTSRRYVSAAQAPNYNKQHPPEPVMQPAVAELEGTPVSLPEKALPLPPDMSRGGSPIEVLQYQRDDLGVQHANLQKVITELQKLEHASPLEVDVKSRRRNREKLAEFTEKLEEVQREEHCVGMALARAIRRAERAEGGESSGLWLRRVTG